MPRPQSRPPSRTSSHPPSRPPSRPSSHRSSRPPSQPPPTSRHSRPGSSYQSPPEQHFSQQPALEDYTYQDHARTSPSRSSGVRGTYQRTPHSEEQFYYPLTPQTSNNLYGTLHSPEFRRGHLPPPPHPPAPPAPPRAQTSRPAFQPSIATTNLPFPNLVPPGRYYRSHAYYNSQYIEHSGVPSFHPDTEPRVGILRPDVQGSTRTRSASTGSGSGSGVQDYIDGDVEATPSPIDPNSIHQWDAIQGYIPSQQSSGSGSYCGDGDDSIDPSLELHPLGSFGDGELEGPSIDPGSAGLEMPNSQKRPNSEYYPSVHHQLQFQSLSFRPGSVNTQRGTIGLNSLVDGEPGQRPAYPIPTIIKCAILGSPQQRLTLSELYLAMEMRFEFFKNSNKKSWRNSVRHNLSLNNQFDKKDRPITEPGKGHYWVVVPDMPQGNKRERKRNKKPGKRALAAMAAEKLAQEQTNGVRTTNADVYYGPHQTTAVHPVALRGYTSGTLPANEGSYAAVTGALPTPQPLDRQLFRPWDGDALPSTSKPGNSAPEQEDRASLTTHNDQGPASPNDAPERRPMTEPESSLRPIEHPSPGQGADSTPSIIHHSGSATTESSSSSIHSEQSPQSRSGYNSLVHVSKPPENAFAELSARIEREGMGTAVSGGPALTTLGKRGRGKSRGMNGWNSDDDDDDASDDDYLPRPRKTRRKIR